jgi:RNA polymerase sigma-70 factor (ECF subfamily)
VFESTVWQVIHRAKDADPKALEEFADKYMGPVRQFIVLQGHPAQAAEDLAQEVFVRIFKDKVLEKADRLKGRFRSLLLAVTKHVLAYQRQQATAIKRGGGKPVHSIDELVDQGMESGLASTADQDEQFDREWMRNLFNRALVKLKGESKLHHDVLQMVMEDEKTYREIADAVGKTEVDIWNYVRAAKRKLVRFVKEQIAEYSSSREEFRSETNYLSKFLEA